MMYVDPRVRGALQGGALTARPNSNGTHIADTKKTHFSVFHVTCHNKSAAFQVMKTCDKTPLRCNGQVPLCVSVALRLCVPQGAAPVEPAAAAAGACTRALAKRGAAYRQATADPPDLVTGCGRAISADILCAEQPRERSLRPQPPAVVIAKFSLSNVTLRIASACPRRSGACACTTTTTKATRALARS